MGDCNMNRSAGKDLVSGHVHLLLRLLLVKLHRLPPDRGQGSKGVVHKFVSKFIRVTEPPRATNCVMMAFASTCSSLVAVPQPSSSNDTT